MTQLLKTWMMVGFVLALLAPLSASAKEFHGQFSGTFLTTAFDSNADGFTASESEGTGRFTQLGKITGRGISETLIWDGSSFCSPTGIVIEVLYFHWILTTESGDMLYSKLLESVPPSHEMCWDYLDFSFEFTGAFQITGGTGRLSESEGEFTCDVTANPLADPFGVTVGYTWEGECAGDLEIPEE